MLVPNFWAEARTQIRFQGRQFTLWRWGWSDVSEADAQALADRRLAEASAAVLAGGSPLRREPKVPYNGADGVPIREEVLARHRISVITRNAYGAHCLNTPDVLFADIDLAPPSLHPAAAGATVLAGGLLAGILLGGIGWFLLGAFTSLVVLVPALNAALRGTATLRGGPAAAALRRISRFAARHPDWHLRVYRTPAGFRILVLHRTFDPADPEVRTFFAALRVDPTYARMCRHQRCFRARLTAKPWRIGIDAHLKPRPGVWPVSPDRLQDRRRWTDEYDRRATDFAACHFITAIGGPATAPEAGAVLRLHDRLCRAETSLTLA